GRVAALGSGPRVARRRRLDGEHRHARRLLSHRDRALRRLLPRAPTRGRRRALARRRRRRRSCSTLARVNTRDTVASAFRAAIDLAAADLGWPPEAKAEPVSVERPADPSHGDYASSIALRLAKPLRTPPPGTAAAITDRFAPSEA